MNLGAYYVIILHYVCTKWKLMMIEILMFVYVPKIINIVV